MAGQVTHLQVGQSLDPTKVFAGPWHSIELVVLGGNQTLQLDGAQLESAVFVEQGEVTLALSHSTVLMGTADAVTLVKGASASLTAGQAGARLFIAQLRAEG